MWSVWPKTSRDEDKIYTIHFKMCSGSNRCWYLSDAGIRYQLVVQQTAALCLLLTHVQVILANIFLSRLVLNDLNPTHTHTNTPWHRVMPGCVFGGEGLMCVGVWSVLSLSWTICLLPGGPTQLDSQHICLPAFVEHHHGGFLIPVPVCFSAPSQNKLHLSIKLGKTVKVSSHPVQPHVKYSF